MKDFLKSIEKGFGFAFGFFILAGLLFGVYAFVAPTSGPSTDYYYDSNSPLLSNSTLEFVGFTATTDGDISGIKGGNTLCDTAFEGSRWMTYDDFKRMSHLYNYTYDVWINYAVGIGYYPEDTVNTLTYESGGLPARSTCYGFTTNSASWTGSILDTDGYLTSATCSNSRRIACIKGQ